MKIAAYVFIGLIVLICVLFFVLGKKSQSGDALGMVNGQLAACPAKPNCVSSESDTSDEAKISGFSAADMDALKAAILAQGGTITKDNGEYVSAEFASSLFKFIDDVELRLDGDHIQIRSGARVGYSDRGVNRQRVEALRATL